MARVERLLLIVAAIALGWYATARADVALYQASQNQAFEELRLERRDVPLASPASPGSPARPRERARATTSRSPVARIEIPRLGVSAIVREGVDNRTLRRAVGHVPGTAALGDAGNSAVAAHRDTFFGPLKDIRKGDRIRVSTPDGDFSYVVHDTRVVEPTDLSVLDPTPEATLTLITCHPFNYVGAAPNRFIVVARAVEPSHARRRLR